jgi:uncharacterized OB-fold protein
MSVPQRRPDRTLGPGHDEFWDWCGKGELRLQRCVSCGEISWPVVRACETCGSAAFTWERMSGHGRIVSWCTFERDYYQGVLPIPWETILVELDEGPLFVSNPIGLTWRDIEFHMPVELTFVECEDAAGTFHLPIFGRA